MTVKLEHVFTSVEENDDGGQLLFYGQSCINVLAHEKEQKLRC